MAMVGSPATFECGQALASTCLTLITNHEPAAVHEDLWRRIEAEKAELIVQMRRDLPIIPPDDG
jgi:hypothetical protein